MTGISSPIAPNWKVPLISIAVDNSMAGTPTDPTPALIVDYMFASGTATPSQPIAVGSPSMAASFFGLGSPVERAFSRFFAINQSQVVYCAGITPPTAGAVATGTITPAGPATAAGTIDLYIAGQNIDVGVSSGDTAAIMATNIAAAINAMITLPVTAAAASGVVTLTSRWKGLTANDITILDSYLGTAGGEILPAGVTLAYSGPQLTGGTGSPDFSSVIANLGDSIYKHVSLAHTDTGSLQAWNTEFGFGNSGRWGWIRMLYGQIWSAARNTYSNMITFGQSLNYPTTSILGWEPQAPSPVWEVAAAYAAQASQAFSADPARPLQTLTLDGLLPAPKSYRWNKPERNALAQSGIAIQTVYSNNTAQIDREQTTYQLNSYGRPDNSYEVATTLATLDAVLTRLANAITSKYPRCKLADDGTPFAPGQAIITPKSAKAELVAEYAELEYDGLCENMAAFKANLICQRSDTDPNTLEVLYPPYLVGQLRNFDVLAQFRLAAATGAVA